jgi:YVTN family beta-propeller protein
MGYRDKARGEGASRMGRVCRRASVAFVVVVGSLAVPLFTSGPAVLAAGSGKTAFVTNAGRNTVTPIDVATKTAGTPIPVGTGPGGVAITPDGRHHKAPPPTAAPRPSTGFLDPVTLATDIAAKANAMAQDASDRSHYNPNFSVSGIVCVPVGPTNPLGFACSGTTTDASTGATTPTDAFIAVSADGANYVTGSNGSIPATPSG